MEALPGFFETWKTLRLRRATPGGNTLHAFGGRVFTAPPAPCGNAIWFILKMFMKDSYKTYVPFVFLFMSFVIFKDRFLLWS